LTLRFAERFAGKAIHQIGQLQQVGKPHNRPPITHHDFQIWAHEIGPLGRNRPNRRVIGLQQEAFAMTIVSSTDTRQLSREQWVKRVRHPHQMLICTGRGCIPM
jgi:hypothetical protein